MITEKDSTNGGKLNLSPFSLLSAMATAGITHLKDALPGTQNDAVAMPQELSVFLAGQITSKMGLFSQFTYAGADGTFGIDNLDFRYANHTTGQDPSRLRPDPEQQSDRSGPVEHDAGRGAIPSSARMRPRPRRRPR